MKKGMILFIGLGLVLGIATARANMNDMKTYKEAFPGATIKCINCHVDAMPKKDAGHELCEYGKAVLGESKDGVTVDTLKKVGKFEDFKKK
jgi:hypothetical protein